MITQMLNIMNTMFQTPQVNKVQTQPKAAIENPFASPFLKENSSPLSFGNHQNQPVPGGYFAGYHNNKKNIVGKKLFVAV